MPTKKRTGKKPQGKASRVATAKAQIRQLDAGNGSSGQLPGPKGDFKSQISEKPGARGATRPTEAIPPSEISEGEAAKKAADMPTAIARAILAKVGEPKEKRAADKGAELSREEQKKLFREKQEKERQSREAEKGGKGGLDKDLFYETTARAFWLRHRGVFETFPEKLLKLHLIDRGVSEFTMTNGMYDIDRVLFDASDRRKVAYCGSLPGYRIGVHRIGALQILVTQEASGVWDAMESFDAAPQFFLDFLQTLLPEDGQGRAQWRHWCAARAVDLRCLRSNDGVFEHHNFKPAPFDGYIGDPGVGKSLLQKTKTIILGGRAENPAKCMFEDEKFNAQLRGAEHWTFGDPVGKTDILSRLRFADKVKEFSHEREFVFRGMQKEGFKVACFRRVDGSFNKAFEDLMRLPPARPGYVDKTNLYLCGDAREVFKQFQGQQSLPGTGVPSVDGVNDQAMIQWLEKNAGLIRAWLLTEFKEVPAALRQTPFAGRYGIDPFHHPALLRELGELSPEAKSLNSICEVLFRVPEGDAPSSDWKRGPVKDLFLDVLSVDLQQVLKLSRNRHPAPLSGKDWDNLNHNLGSKEALGRLLGRLAENHPDRVVRRPERSGYQYWQIMNPFLTEQTTADNPPQNTE